MSTRPREARPNTRAFFHKLWREARPISGTCAATYLQERGVLLDPWPADIRFHPCLKHTPSGRTFPAMVCAIRRLNPETRTLQLTGIHRTYLAPDGRSKADVSPNKMMLGATSGGAVVLAMPTDGRLLIAEGIENALTAMHATGTPAWAALSAGNLPKLQLPPPDIARHITLIADADPTGMRFAEHAAAAWTQEGYAVKLALPPAGKDINDVLREGAV